jgi:hypothetical protein
VIDRRVGQRRRGFGRVDANRRSQDRRDEQPPTWEEGDFIVVRTPDGSAHLSPSARVPEFDAGPSRRREADTPPARFQKN